MKRVVLSLTIFLACFGLVSNSEAQRFASTDRRAVVLEAFYALRPSHDGSCDKTITGQCVSNWNYLNSDIGSYQVLKSWYACNASDWAVRSDTCYYAGALTGASFYSALGTYGYGTFGGSYGPLGRGGQCTFFANMILHRSGSHSSPFPTLQTMWANTEPNLQKAVEGDVIQVYGDSHFTNHVAIVVEIKRSGSVITGLDVIDANFISDVPGMADREVIARHLLLISNILNHYRIWKGTAYYYEPYHPNY